VRNIRQFRYVYEGLPRYLGAYEKSTSVTLGSLGAQRQSVQDRDPRKFRRTNEAVQKTRLRGVTPNSSVELVQTVQERDWEKFRRTKHDSSP
jgi:hypothetical protein